MGKLVQISIVVWLSLFCGANARAVDPSTRISQYGHTVWRLHDGLLSAEPNAIAQSKEGYIWIGTENGLVRFDGVRFQQWTPPHWDEISDHNVNILYPASDGTMWIGTPTNIASLRDGVLTVIHTSKPVYVNGIVEDSAHHIWFATTRRVDVGLCEVVKDDTKCVPSPVGAIVGGVHNLEADAHGILTFSSGSLLVDWDPERGSVSSHQISDFAPKDSVAIITTVMNQPDGSKLIGILHSGTGLGLQRLSGTTLTPYMKPGLDGSTLSIMGLYLDRKQVLWIATRGDGLYRVAGDSVDHYQKRDGLSGNSVRNIREDREGNLWVATEGGVDCFRDLKVVTWSPNQGLSNGSVRSVLATKNNTQLIGIDDKINLLRDGNVSLLPNLTGKPKGIIGGMLEDSAGRYWIGVGNELGIFDGRRFKLLKRSDGRPIGTAFSLTSAPDGSVWAIASDGTFPRQLLHLQDDKVIELLRNEAFSLKVVSDLSGGVWVSGIGKIAHYANGRLDLIALGPKPNPKSFSVQDDLVISTDGTVFRGSYAGLWIVRNHTVRVLNTTNGLPCNEVNGLVLSQDQSLWLRTSCGLIEISHAAIDAWWSRPNSAITYKLLDSLDGATPSRALFFPEMSLAQDGRIWIGNEDTAQVVDPTHIPSNTLPPPVHIEEIVADHREIARVAGLRMGPRLRNLELHYTALSLSVPQKVKFRYMLENHDSVWQDAGSRRVAFYNDLRPGHYRFHVIAANNDGVWNNTGDTFAFDVKPVWYQTAWFRGSLLIIFSLGLWLIYRMRVNHIADEINARFNERLDERTRVARELHDTLLQTLQGSKMVADGALGASMDQDRTRQALERLSTWLEQAVTEVRAAVIALRAPASGQNQLTEYINKILEEHCVDSLCSTTVTVTGDPQDLHSLVESEVSLIAKEAISNACLHSKATRLHVELQYAKDLVLLVRDNGAGINADVLENGRQGHFGLKGMRERSAQIRATIEIHSSVGHGTEVRLSVPGKVAYRQGEQTLFRRLVRRLKYRKPRRGYEVIEE